MVNTTLKSNPVALFKPTFANNFILGYAGYLKAVWPEFFGCVFEVWPAPGAREGPQKCGGRCLPHF